MMKSIVMKLHIGGEEPKDGWKIVDIQKKPHVDFIADISDLSQFDDQSIADIYASHVFEHVPQPLALKTLKGIHRILKVGGRFYVSVPDLDILCRLFIEPQASATIKWHAMKMMFGAQVDQHDFHYVGWNYGFLLEYLTQAGFSAVEKVESFGLFKDASDYKPYGFPISLNVIATR